MAKITMTVLKEQLQYTIEERDNLKLANTVLNQLVATQHAEIEVRKSELRIIKQEIEKLKHHAN